MATERTAVIGDPGVAVTLINVYEVVPERQAELLALLERAADEVFRKQPGFVSVCLHAGVDGQRVVNYTQWATPESFAALAGNAEAQARIRGFAAVATTVTPALYRVASVTAR